MECVFFQLVSIHKETNPENGESVKPLNHDIFNKSQHNSRVEENEC